jgi:hypothetical protein
MPREQVICAAVSGGRVGGDAGETALAGTSLKGTGPWVGKEEESARERGTMWHSFHRAACDGAATPSQDSKGNNDFCAFPNRPDLTLIREKHEDQAIAELCLLTTAEPA